MLRSHPGSRAGGERDRGRLEKFDHEPVECLSLMPPRVVSGPLNDVQTGAGLGLDQGSAERDRYQRIVSALDNQRRHVNRGEPGTEIGINDLFPGMIRRKGSGAQPNAKRFFLPTIDRRLAGTCEWLLSIASRTGQPGNPAATPIVL